ncbi:HET-domain-containing protein, partial [Cadophora sp. DSE1049]
MEDHASDTQGIYSPLTTDSDEIRLLVLQPSNSLNQTIECTLSIANISSRPTYEALSYMWGPDDLRGSWYIRMNGEHFAIRENLFRALRSLRHGHEPRVLWIDALCINQKSILERGHQVRQMGEVYSTAKQVIVWLGKHQQSSSLRGKDPLYLLKWLELRDNATLAIDAMEVLQILSRNEYWQRLWIVQEIYMAKSIII